MEIQFSKYQGTGNDFVIIDNRAGNIALSNAQIAFLCDRKFGVGSDGLMFLGTASGYDFSMDYYNANGTEGTMCGNGGRCLVQYANDHGIVKENYLKTVPRPSTDARADPALAHYSHHHLNYGSHGALSFHC